MADIRLSDKASLGVVSTTLTGATTITVNKEYRMDSSGGAFTVTLPDVDRSNDRIILVDETGSLATNAVTVSADPSDTIDGGASIIMDFDNSILELRADAGTNNWVIVKFSKFAGGEIDTTGLTDTPIVGADEIAYHDASGGETVKRTFTNMITDLGIGGGGPIDDLSDADTTTVAPVVGDTLTWDGSNWVPAVPSIEHVQSIMSSDYSVADTTAYADVPGLSITLPSDGDWLILCEGQAQLLYNNVVTSNIVKMEVAIFDGSNVLVPNTTRRSVEIDCDVAVTNERSHSNFATSAFISGATSGDVYKLRVAMDQTGFTSSRTILASTEECVIRALRMGG